MASNTAGREVKHFHCSFTKYEGQMVISKRYYKNKPNTVSEIFKMTDIIKYLTPQVILELNEKIYQNGSWSVLYKSVPGF